MKIAVLGTGSVGQTLGSKLVELGHEVRMGSRTSGNDKAVAWAEAAGDGAGEGDFAQAAAYGELVINATAGKVSLEALEAAGAGNLSGKLLIDVCNPLDFSRGFPPRLSVCNDDSVAEQIQRTYPDARVVKAFNTVTAALMVDPEATAGGDHTLMMAGDEEGAKSEVRELAQSFGWRRESILDLGDVTAARGMEMYLALWVRLMGATGGPRVTVKVVS